MCARVHAPVCVCLLELQWNLLRTKQLSASKVVLFFLFFASFFIYIFYRNMS